MKVIICKGQMMGPISGADETLVTYATYLQQAGVSVSVLLMFSRPHESYHARLRRVGVPVSSIAHDATTGAMLAGRALASRLLQTLPHSQRLVRGGSRRLSGGVARRYFWRCRERLAEHRPDVLHVITPDPASMIFIKAAHSLGIPVLYHELGIPFHPPGYKAYYQHFTSVLPLCSKVAALSPTLAKLCHQQMPLGLSISVLPIMADDISPAPQNTGGGCVFGFAARIEKIKGTSELMEAFGLAHRRNGEIKLSVAGAGSKMDEMRARAKALGVNHHFQYLGVYEGSEGRADFLRNIDVLILPSYTEGTPNSIVEAMSQGIPVIASAVGGISDMLGQDAGLLVPVGDAAVLANAMLLLARDKSLRASMGQAARERYERLFSPSVVTPLLLQTYGELMAAPSMPAT